MEVLAIFFFICIPSGEAYLPLPEKKTLLLNKDIPYVIRGGCKHVEAVNRWSSDYLINHSQDSDIQYRINPEFYKTGVETKKDHKMKLKDFILEKATYKYITELQLWDLPKKLFDETFDYEREHLYPIIGEFLTMGYNETGTSFHLHRADDYTVCLIFGGKEMVFFDPVEAHVPIDHSLLVATNKSYVSALHKGSFEIKNHPVLYKTYLRKGDLVYIPPWWYHNAINKQFTTAITSIYYRSDWSYVVHSYKFVLAALSSKLKDEIFNGHWFVCVILVVIPGLFFSFSKQSGILLIFCLTSLYFNKF
jgi:hypothetical protein